MGFKVYKSDDGRIAVKSTDDDFVASCKHGEWSNDMMFDPYELMEIPVVEDPTEAAAIVSSAKRALTRW